MPIKSNDLDFNRHVGELNIITLTLVCYLRPVGGFLQIFLNQGNVTEILLKIMLKTKHIINCTKKYSETGLIKSQNKIEYLKKETFNR